MEIASKYNSDIELLNDMYINWFDAGKTSDPICVRCGKTLPPYVLKKDQGCRLCRVKFSNENRLNNKIMETILNSKDQVMQIIKRTPNNIQRNPDITLTEIIGRCLISSFREQMGELLLPENPDAGVHLLDNGGKAVFSSTSAFAQKQQTSYSEVISMKITQISKGYMILDQVHPILSEWIPEKYMKSLVSLKKDMQECLVCPNLNIRYRYILSKELRALEPTHQWLYFTVVTYDNLNSTLKVHGPKSEFYNIRDICKGIIDKLKKQDLEYESMMLIANKSANAFFVSGMNIEKIETGSVSRIRFTYDSEKTQTRSKEDFIKWICKISNVKKEAIKWCNIFKKNEDDKSYADMGFHDKEIAKKVRNVVSDTLLQIVNAKEKSVNVLITIRDYPLSQNKFEKLVKGGMYQPIDIQNHIFYHRTYSIFINNLPPDCDSERKIHCSLPHLRNLDRVLLKENQYEYYAILNFSDYEDRNYAFDQINSL